MGISLSSPLGGVCLIHPSRCPLDAALSDTLGCTWGQRPGAEHTSCSDHSFEDWGERQCFLCMMLLQSFAWCSFLTTIQLFLITIIHRIQIYKCFNLQQRRNRAMRASESYTQFLQSLISYVVVWQVHLADDALLWCQCLCELSTALVCQATSTQAEVSSNENRFFFL